MKKVSVTKFVKPYPQDALGGEDGLTSTDIALALGTTKKNVEDVLKRSGFFVYARKAGLNIATIIAESRNRGRKPSYSVLDVEAARVFSARYGSQAGFDYCLWLVRIETKLIPSLYQKIAALEAELSKRLNRRKNESTMRVPRYQEDLFGKIVLTHFETVQKTLLSHAEQIEAQQIHISKIMEGLGKKNGELTIEAGMERRQKDSAIVKLVKDLNPNEKAQS